MYQNKLGIEDIPIGLTGDKLSRAITEDKKPRAPFAEGLIYENTFNMIYGEAGLGKSTILSQMCVELSAGLPVWGYFKTTRPYKVLYIQGERDIMETTERLELLKEVYPINFETLVITDEYQRLNLLNPNHVEIFINCINRDCPGVEIVCIDPIYSMVSGGLKDDIPASAFTKAMSLVQRSTGASMIYGHHIVKPQWDKGTKYEKDDPFYGSNWLKAHCTSMLLLKGTAEGVRLERKKDNYRLVPERTTLEYNGENGLCTVPLSDLPAEERIKNFIRAQGLSKKEFTFKDIEDSTGVCTRRARELVLHSSIRDMLIVVSTKGNKKLYKSSTAD